MEEENYEKLVDRNDFLISENDIIFTGLSPSKQLGISGFKNGSVNANNEFPDIAIVNVEVDSMVGNIDPILGMLTRRRIWFKITVQNVGEAPIYSFGTNLTTNISSYCTGNSNYKTSHYEKMTNVSIAPNEFYSFTFLTFVSYTPFISSNNYLCFEVMAPMEN